jgi:type I restriction enzyme M protein
MPIKKSELYSSLWIFDTPALDFRGNRADGDDLFGDAYECLMRHLSPSLTRAE